MCVYVQERQLGKERISSIRCTTHSVMIFFIFPFTVHWFVSICFSAPLQRSSMELVWISTIYGICLISKEEGDMMESQEKVKKKIGSSTSKVLCLFLHKKKTKDTHKGEEKSCLHYVLCFSVLYPLD